MRDVDLHRERASATLMVDAENVRFLRSAVVSIDEEADADDNYRRVRATAPTETLLARGLSGWGEFITVVEPESLRAELARIGAELVARNA